MADPIRQLLSQTSYDADGTTTVWNFSFAGGYLDREHVKVQVMNKVTLLVTQIPITDANFIGDYQLQLIPPIEVGQELTIYRDSPKDLPLVDFADRAALTEAALDLNAKQAIFASAEVVDTVNTSLAAVSQVGAQVAAAEGYAEDAAGHAVDAANQVLLATAKATQANASAAASSNSAQDASDFAAAAAASAESVDTAFLLNRANHTGTQDASTVTVSGSPLPTVLGQKADTSAMNSAISTASTADRNRANHTGTQDASTVTVAGTPLPTALGTKADQSTVNALPKPFGIGQTRQNVTASRSSNVAYQNSTGRTIEILVSFMSSAAGQAVRIDVAGQTSARTGSTGAGEFLCASRFILPGETYLWAANSGAQAVTVLEVR